MDSSDHWGNGNIQPGNDEKWDDGNKNNGDGCSDNCIIEPGWTCNGSHSIWQMCGNSKIEGTELWDDGNIDIV